MAVTYIGVNKSGIAVPVHNTLGGTQIGTINNREAYGIYGTSEGDEMYILFRNSSGSVVEGVITAEDTNYNYSLYAPISDYPDSTINLFDYITNTTKPHVVFKVRTAQTVYDNGGAKWGSVAAGQYVAAKADYEAQNGSNHADWLQINYVKSTSGSWVSINQSFGFVPMGLQTASGYASIPVYGSW